MGGEDGLGAREGRLAGLDLLRAVAIAAVMVYHLHAFLPAMFAPVAAVGWMGVDLFFVLSGYLIGVQVLRPGARGERLRMGEFYTRRAFRILPAFGVVWAMYALWPMWREAPELPAWWKLATFTANLLMRYPEQRAFSHVWSLCVEEQFYLVLPVLVVWAGRRRWTARTVVAALVGVVLLGVAVRWWVLFREVLPAGEEEQSRLFATRIYYPTWSRLDGLVAGVAVALARVFRPGWWRWVERRANGVLLAGVAVWGAAVWMFRGQDAWVVVPMAVVLGFPVMAAGLALLVAATATGGGVLRRRVPGARWLAAMAFSLYLTHKEVGHVDRMLWPWMEDNTGWRAAGVYLVTCVGAGAALYWGVERPGLRLRDWWMGRAVPVEVEARLDPAL